MSTKGESLISAFPAKRFFVEMLTRDIELEDAILDLLDNCIDGVLRCIKDRDKEQPYKGFWSKISFNEEHFRIEDNCGGIDRDIAEKYAFMMGRPKGDFDTKLPTVGMYGIGMKRAIFKIGTSARVHSYTPKDNFEVRISPEWLKKDDDWNLPLKPLTIPMFKENNFGTIVEVKKLNESIKLSFSKQSDFEDKLYEKISTHYSFIINKGFSVSVNNKPVNPIPVKLLFSDKISPYIYKAKIDDIDINLYVGFYKPTPSSDELEESQETRRTRNQAGWTIICNDRVVLYCDKTRMTGWGEANVPDFHAQFNAIAGAVEFKSNNALNLPITTTKRGIDASSNIYLYVKDFMREGLKFFTNYTYKWKTNPEEKQNLVNANLLNFDELSLKIHKQDWEEVKRDPKPNSSQTTKIKQQKYKPKLPMPPKKTDERNIRFSKTDTSIKKVSLFLFEDEDHEPSEVGSKAFDYVLKKAK